MTSRRGEGYFYPRPPRGGRPQYEALKEALTKFLSTPSAWWATLLFKCRFRAVKISIHALREEGDHQQKTKGNERQTFLSTPSARRATSSGKSALSHGQYFYPRPPRGGRLLGGNMAESSGDFYPRPPRGGRPLKIVLYKWIFYFYPRPPRGGRPQDSNDFVVRHIFLSTPSARRATAKTETKSLFSNKLYNILHEFRRALIYNGSKSYPNHAK